MESICNACNVFLTAEDIYDWEVIDLEGCHGPEGDILGGYVTSLVLLLGTTIYVGNRGSVNSRYFLT